MTWPTDEEYETHHGDGIYSLPRENVRALCDLWEREGDDGDPTDLLIFKSYEDS